uniref:Peptidase S1 domain-containing protein n=1 Tax=Sus scrofa TaxID=9823 RepID=A0A8D1UQ44_PIG
HVQSFFLVAAIVPGPSVSGKLVDARGLTKHHRPYASYSFSRNSSERSVIFFFFFSIKFVVNSACCWHSQKSVALKKYNIPMKEETLTVNWIRPGICVPDVESRVCWRDIESTSLCWAAVLEPAVTMLPLPRGTLAMPGDGCGSSRWPRLQANSPSGTILRITAVHLLQSESISNQYQLANNRQFCTCAPTKMRNSSFSPSGYPLSHSSVKWAQEWRGLNKRWGCLIIPHPDFKAFFCPG